MSSYTVVHVTNYYYPTIGGITTYIKELTDHLSKEGINNTIIAYPHLFRKVERLLGKGFLRYIVHYMFMIFYILWAILCLSGYKISFKKVIVNSHDANFCALIGVFGRYLGYKSVHIFHTAPAIDQKSKFVIWYNQKIFNRLHKLVFVANHVKKKFDRLYQIPEERKIVMYTGISIPRNWKNIKSEYSKRILFIGNLNKNKDPLTLVKAFREFKKKNDSKLIIVGGGPLKSKIIKYCNKHNLNESVILKGVLQPKDTHEELRKADVLVLTSKDEGLALVLLEANSYGLPVISTRCGGPEEIVKSGYNGYLIDKGDSSDLCSKLNTVFLKWHSLSKNARKFAIKNFSWDSKTFEYINLYEDLYHTPNNDNNISFVFEGNFTFDLPGPSRIFQIGNYLSQKCNVYIMFDGLNSGKKIPYSSLRFISVDTKFENKSKYRFIKQIYKLLQQNNVKTVVFRNPLLIVLFRIISLFSKYHIVYDLHAYRYLELNVIGNRLKSVLYYFIEKLAVAFSDSIILINEGLLDYLPKRKRSRTTICPNGVDLSEFSSAKSTSKLLKRYGIQKSKKTIGVMGNYIEWLDIESVILSAQSLPEYQFLIIGGGYNNFITKLKIPKNILFLGRVPHTDVVSLYSIFDIALLPYKKAKNISLLSLRKMTEYLAAGLPIISSDVAIREKEFLKENSNYVEYSCGNYMGLVKSIKKVILNDGLRMNMSKNNLDIVKEFTWAANIKKANFRKIFPQCSGCQNNSIQLSIIIKALNEEDHIEESIESALGAIKGLKGEVILVDSKSTDNTLKLAKKYPIKILQLKDEKERCCGIGPQTGYLYSRGKFVYILDGDMKLNPKFIPEALKILKNPIIAGVGGNINEISKENLTFQSRTKDHIVAKKKFVDQLGMGGLYKRVALEKIGYFSNPYFYAYEEYDLGAKLTTAGYKLMRIPIRMVDHFGDETTSLQTLIRRWRSRYLFGTGQYLRCSIRGKHFLRTLRELEIYFFTFMWQLAGVLSLIYLYSSPMYFIVYAIITVLFVLLILLKKRNVNRTIFSLLSWNFQAIAMIYGFFLKPRSPAEYVPNVKIIK